MGVNKVKYEITKSYKTIQKLIEQHGEVRVIFAEITYNHKEKKHVAHEDMRRRILKKNGTSIVSYKRSRRSWSGYGKSCFVLGKNLQDFKQALKLMREHDGHWLKPIEVHYGWFFLKKVIL